MDATEKIIEMLRPYDLSGSLTERVIEAHTAATQATAERARVETLVWARSQYDDMELAGNDIDTMEYGPEHKFVTWRGWKMVRNVLTDEIERLTGSRSPQLTSPTNPEKEQNHGTR